ncbi:MAG TPA: sensor histidine kinase [Acidimicrobiales bacterium]|nr:sensor histidine kinase [Acidimicrobiales bacterium]
MTRRSRMGDAALALAVGVVQVAGTYLAGRHQADREPFDVLAGLLLLAGPAALVVRRRFPVAVYVTAFAATLGYVSLGYPRGPIFFSLIVSFLTVALAGHRVVAWVGLAVGYVGFLWAEVVFGDLDGPGWEALVGLAAWLLVLAAAGEGLRIRRVRTEEAARAREEESRRRAGEERLRIARELHDVLAHNISLINVQAGVALHLMEEKPEQARTALTAIKAASKDALGELRSVLDVLRMTGPGGRSTSDVDEGAPRAPTTGLEDLDRLVSGATAAGVDVRVVTEGTPRPLPPSVDLAAFRIVQEALTNVTRHAGQATATISLTYGDERLTVQVDDDGRGVNGAGPGSGNGIRGMKERASALGGELRAGPKPGGGFRVTASLPG